MSTTLDRSAQAADRGKREVRQGTVVSDKGNKTIRVRYDFMVKHDKYGKYYRRSTILSTHDENNDAKAGDIVEVVSCRRVSKTKCWRLLRVVEQRSADQVVPVNV